MNELEVLVQFFSRIRKAKSCWVWVGSKRTHYGRFAINRKTYPAHRWLFEYINGPVQEGLCLDHLCRNRLCVNPAHLEPVTPKENILRGTGFAAVNAKKTHCIHGHKFTPENTYLPKGRKQRLCRLCRNRSNKMSHIRRFKERYETRERSNNKGE